MSQTPLVFQSQVAGSIEKTLKPNATGTSTVETAFQVNGNSIANISPFVLPLGVGNPGVFVGGSYALSSLTSTGLPFRVRLFGFATTGTTENLTIKLYVVPAASIAGLTSTSFTGATAIATTGAVAVNSTTGGFELEVTLLPVAESTTSVTLQGAQGASLVNNTLVAAAAITAVTGLQGETDLNFFVTSTLSAGNAADVVTLTGLQLEYVG
jgi:hypothetical protein